MPDITLITYGGSLVTPQHDALMADAELSGNGILYGCEVSVPSANQLHITHGVGVIYGREFEIAEHNINVESPQSGSLSGQVLIRLALSAPTPISIEVETAQTLTPLEDNADINTNTAHVTEMQLATFTIDINGISNVRQTAPQIERMPDVVSSLNSRLAELETDSGWKTIGSYIVYRVINNIVYLRVRQSGGTVRQSGFSFGTLPAAIAPVFSLAEANVYGVGRIFINQDHSVTFETSLSSETSNYIQASFVYPLR